MTIKNSGKRINERINNHNLKERDVNEDAESNIDAMDVTDEGLSVGESSDESSTESLDASFCEILNSVGGNDDFQLIMDIITLITEGDTSIRTLSVFVLAILK